MFSHWTNGRVRVRNVYHILFCFLGYRARCGLGHIAICLHCFLFFFSLFSTQSKKQLHQRFWGNFFSLVTYIDVNQRFFCCNYSTRVFTMLLCAIIEFQKYMYCSFKIRFLTQSPYDARMLGIHLLSSASRIYKLCRRIPPFFRQPYSGFFLCLSIRAWIC